MSQSGVKGSARLTIVAEGQLHDIIASPDAWNISDEVVEGEDPSEGSKATTSSRQVKALIEQVTGEFVISDSADA